jgi:hypothetical protein
MRWEGYVARMEKKRKYAGYWWETTWEALGEDNNKMNLTETGLEVLYWIKVAKEKDIS